MYPLLFIWRAIRTSLFIKFHADCRCFPSTWSARLLRPRALSPLPIAPVTMAATVGSRWRHRLRLRTAQEVGLLTCLIFYTRPIDALNCLLVPGASASVEDDQEQPLIFAQEHPNLPIHSYFQTPHPKIFGICEGGGRTGFG